MSFSIAKVNFHFQKPKSHVLVIVWHGDVEESGFQPASIIQDNYIAYILTHC